MKFKKLFSLLLIVPFLFVFMATLVACKKKEEPKIDYNGMKINMTDWTSIGAAEIGKFDNISASNVSFGNASSVSSSSSKKFALVGADKNGNYKKIKFHKDGKEHEPELNLQGFNQTDNFIFLSYYTGEKDYSGIYVSSTLDSQTTDFRANKFFQNYIVDKTTGNIYKMDITYQVINNIYAFSSGKTPDEMKKKLLIRVYHERDDGYYSYQEVTIENNRLKFVELFNNDTFGERWVSVAAGDRFGNKIIDHYNNYYVLTKDNVIKTNVPTLPDDSHLGGFRMVEKDMFNNLYINGADGYYKLLEDGTFEKVTTEPKFYNYNGRNAIKIEGSTEYYLNIGNDSKIEKVEYTDTDFTVTEILLEDFVDNYKVGQDYIFTLKNNVITKYSIIDGTKTIVNIDEDLIFKTWEIVGNDEIFFTATNNILQEVKCLIDGEGISHYTYTDIIFKIYYLMPINNNES